jgi:hypothetical protein
MKLRFKLKILVISVFISFFLYFAIAPRFYCENFKKGLKDSYDKDVYCKVKKINYCPYDFSDGVYDFSKFTS